MQITSPGYRFLRCKGGASRKSEGNWKIKITLFSTKEATDPYWLCTQLWYHVHLCTLYVCFVYVCGHSTDRLNTFKVYNGLPFHEKWWNVTVWDNGCSHSYLRLGDLKRDSEFIQSLTAWADQSDQEKDQMEALEGWTWVSRYCLSVSEYFSKVQT